MATPWNREAQPCVRLNTVIYINLVMSGAVSSTSNADLARPAKALSHRLPDVEVKTTADWSSTQRNYCCPGRWPRRCLP